jgi:pimeloyl-ACP methyl ester carboxylesterase
VLLQVGDVPVHVQLDGASGAPPVLLTHTLGTSLHVWDERVMRLCRSFRVVRSDLRGHGLSGVTRGPYSIEGLAPDCFGVLDALEIETAHVAGISIGGMIAQVMAAEAPRRVVSLILCDTANAIPGREIYTERARTVRAQGMDVIADAVMARWVTPGFLDSPAAEGLRAMVLLTAARAMPGPARRSWPATCPPARGASRADAGAGGRPGPGDAAGLRRGASRGHRGRIPRSHHERVAYSHNRAADRGCGRDDSLPCVAAGRRPV